MLPALYAFLRGLAVRAGMPGAALCRRQLERLWKLRSPELLEPRRFSPSLEPFSMFLDTLNFSKAMARIESELAELKAEQAKARVLPLPGICP